MTVNVTEPESESLDPLSLPLWNAPTRILGLSKFLMAMSGFVNLTLLKVEAANALKSALESPRNISMILSSSAIRCLPSSAFGAGESGFGMSLADFTFFFFYSSSKSCFFFYGEVFLQSLRRWTSL